MGAQIQEKNQIASQKIGQAIKTLNQAGWFLSYADLVFGDVSEVKIRLYNNSGRVIYGFADNLGRATLETFQRQLKPIPGLSKSHWMHGQLRAAEVFIGRQKCLGPRNLMKRLAHYIAAFTAGLELQDAMNITRLLISGSELNHAPKD